MYTSCLPDMPMMCTIIGMPGECSPGWYVYSMLSIYYWSIFPQHMCIFFTIWDLGALDVWIYLYLASTLGFFKANIWVLGALALGHKFWESGRSPFTDFQDLASLEAHAWSMTLHIYGFWGIGTGACFEMLGPSPWPAFKTWFWIIGGSTLIFTWDLGVQLCFMLSSIKVYYLLRRH